VLELQQLTSHPLMSDRLTIAHTNKHINCQGHEQGNQIPEIFLAKMINFDPVKFISIY